MKRFKPHDNHMYFELVVVHALHFKILFKWGGTLRRLDHRICCTSMNMRTWESREFQLDNLWRPDTTGLIGHRYRCTQSSRMWTTLHDIMIDWRLECNSQRKHYDTPYIPKGERNNKYKGVPHQVLIRSPCSSCLMFFFWTLEPASRAWRPRQPMVVSVEKSLPSGFSPPCGRLPHVITAPSHRSAAKAASELLEVAIHLWKKCRCLSNRINRTLFHKPNSSKQWNYISK